MRCFTGLAAKDYAIASILAWVLIAGLIGTPIWVLFYIDGRPDYRECAASSCEPGLKSRYAFSILFEVFYGFALIYVVRIAKVSRIFKDSLVTSFLFPCLWITARLCYRGSVTRCKDDLRSPMLDYLRRIFTLERARQEHHDQLNAIREDNADIRLESQTHIGQHVGRQA